MCVLELEVFWFLQSTKHWWASPMSELCMHNNRAESKSKRLDNGNACGGGGCRLSLDRALNNCQRCSRCHLSCLPGVLWQSWKLEAELVPADVFTAIRHGWPSGSSSWAPEYQYGSDSAIPPWDYLPRKHCSPFSQERKNEKKERKKERLCHLEQEQNTSFNLLRLTFGNPKT